MEREQIIEGIRLRIISEHQKHPTLNWAGVAARKIYATYIAIPELLAEIGVEEEETPEEKHEVYYWFGSMVLGEGSFYAVYVKDGCSPSKCVLKRVDLYGNTFYDIQETPSPAFDGMQEKRISKELFDSAEKKAEEYLSKFEHL